MHTNLMKGIVLSNKNKEGQNVRIKVLTGPLNGKEFQAKRVHEHLNEEVVSCYHIEDNGTSTYFLEKDVSVID